MGDIVAVEGRPDEWELMRRHPAPGMWQIEPARPQARRPDVVHTNSLQALQDAPHVRRADLVMQNYPEQRRAATVGHVYRLGRWVAATARPEKDGRTEERLDDVERLVVVTREQVDAAVQIAVRSGHHRGWILQAVVTRHAGKIRVTCRCLDNIEIARMGRKVGWCSSVEAARALWDWHVAGEVAPAPPDFSSGS